MQFLAHALRVALLLCLRCVLQVLRRLGRVVAQESRRRVERLAHLLRRQRVLAVATRKRGERAVEMLRSLLDRLGLPVLTLLTLRLLTLLLTLRRLALLPALALLHLA